MAAKDNCCGDDSHCEVRVLTVESSVVWGHIGNESVVFPLQVLGFDVSTINSVQFSNHTGYGKWKGQVLNAQDVSDLFEGLRMNGLLQFSHVLTGYIGSESFLEKVAETVSEMRKSNPALKYVCDPVMGDNGKLYVRKELVPVYRKVVTLADIITPNQFELEILTESEVTSEQEAFVAIDKLHQQGVKTVVLSSSSLGTKGILLCLASTAANGKPERFRLEIPQIEARFVGTGDLFAASLLAWMHKDGNLKVALEKTVATVQSVIQRTLAYAEKVAGEGKQPTPAQMELRLIQSKASIECPDIELHAEDVSHIPVSKSNS
ncbi:hypothetical protein BaRGS_00011585 [Batillaria attramentaria]|uniref:Pyridoxal kinase n=1 Tax=Batillaria attramentaria TaxID=370345 RepID=A0ABD0LCR1_9CAEN